MIVQEKNRWLLIGEDGTVLGNYATEAGAAKAAAWWEKMGQERAERQAQEEPSHEIRSPRNR